MLIHIETFRGSNEPLKKRISGLVAVTPKMNLLLDFYVDLVEKVSQTLKVAL